MNEQDPPGLWYSLLEREHGEYMGIRFGRASLSSGEVEWMDLPHRLYDGVGGLWELQRRCYGADGAAPMPAPRERHRPGQLGSWGLFLRFAARPQPRAAPWLSFDPAWRGSSPERSRPSSLSWCVLDPEQTRALIERARSMGVSVTSLLLCGLGRAIVPSLDLTRGPVRWVVPVNMRGAITREPATANHSAYVYAETPPRGSVQDIERSLRISLDREDHFAAWHGFTLGSALGTWGLGRVIEAGFRYGPTWIGVFSNLGVWPERADSHGRDETWIFCPPVPRNQPLGAGVLTWHGRMSLALQAHPALRADREEVARWLDAWVASALSGCSG